MVAARELQITLTSRNKEKGIAIPMCGVPYHSAENYIAKLIRKGFKVAICEQMEDPRAGQEAGEARGHARADAGNGGRRASWLGGEQLSGLRGARRKCRRICRARSFHRRVSRHRIQWRRRRAPRARRAAGAASARSAVRFVAAAVSISRERNASGRPSAGCRPAHRIASRMRSWAETPLDDWVFAPDYAIPQVENHFGVLSLEGFGLAEPRGRRDGRGRHPALRSHHAARLARPRRPHRLLRAPELPGAGRGHRPQPGADRAALRRLGRTVPRSSAASTAR